MNFCKGNINAYINFDIIYLATYFFHVWYWIRFCLVSLFISMFLKFIVYSLNFVLCLHLPINSLLLFNNFSGNLYVIIFIFTSKNKLHLPSKLFGVFNFFKIDHSISGVNPLFFKHQNCFDCAVWCFRCSWEKVNLWFEYLSFYIYIYIYILNFIRKHIPELTNLWVSHRESFIELKTFHRHSFEFRSVLRKTRTKYHLNFL